MTRRIVQTTFVVAVALAIGWFARGWVAGPVTSDLSADRETGGPCADGAAPLYWKAPMDPTFVRDEPGKSPMGMDLVPECPSGARTAADGAVEIDSQTVQRLGVRTAQVARRDLARSIRAVGRVAYDERLVEHVHTKIEGWVEELHVDFVGQQVTRGQPLLEVYSPALVATQEELLLASRYQGATQDSPFEDVRGGGASLFQATKRRLELWDVPERDIDRLLETQEIQKTLTLYAPTGGVVTRLGVRAGMKVGPNQNLYTIADLSRVWVLADVYEYELPWLSLGQIGVVSLPYLPEKTFSGPLRYISPFLDPKTRTAEVRLELPNPDGALRPEMFGETRIEAAPRESVIAVPSEAVIRSGRRSLVIVALGEGRFTPRTVSLGMDSGDGWLEVTDGLAPGEDIVLSGQFLIDSESNLQAVVRGLLAASEPEEMDPEHAMPPAEPMGHEHAMPPAEPMGHEHAMPPAEPMGHEHAMPPAEPVGHEHAMPPAEPAHGDHEHLGHPMPAAD